MRPLLLLSLLALGTLCFAQDSSYTGMGGKSFDHLYEKIKEECGTYEYASVKKQRKKVKLDLWAIDVVNKVVNGNLSLQEADSVLRRKEIKPLTLDYHKPGFAAKVMRMNVNYMQVTIITATRTDTPVTFIGAVVRSSYKLHCKGNPLFEIPSVSIDVDFFRQKVMPRITCRHEVFNILALGAASYMWTELRFIF